MANVQSFPKEYKIPGILLAIGLVILLGFGLVKGGVDGMVGMATALPIVVLITVLPGLLVGGVAAKFMGADYGNMGSAVLKFLAIIFFALALTFFIPAIGFIVQAGIWVVLLIWLFEMTPGEAVTLTIVAVVVNFIALFLIGAAAVASLR